MTKRCGACGVEKPLAEYGKWRARCNPCRAVQARDARAANPERQRAASARWYAANTERQRITSAAWRAANVEKHRASKAAYRKANPEKGRANNAAWAKANPEAYRASTSARRIRVRRAALAVLGGVCVQCGSTELLEIDHIHGGGDIHRKTENTGSYVWRLASTGVPDPRLQLLCHDCHMIKTATEKRERDNRTTTTGSDDEM